MIYVLKRLFLSLTKTVRNLLWSKSKRPSMAFIKYLRIKTHQTKLLLVKIFPRLDMLYAFMSIEKALERMIMN